MATNNYTITIPESVTIVTTWNELRAQVPKYLDSMLVEKHGGYVIESDDTIVVATSDNLTEEVDSKMVGLPEDDDAVDDTASNANNEPVAGTEFDANLFKRGCTRPGCFNFALCLTYTDCHVCTSPGVHRIRGYCI
jgi:hypothetical protein